VIQTTHIYLFLFIFVFGEGGKNMAVKNKYTYEIRGERAKPVATFYLEKKYENEGENESILLQIEVEGLMPKKNTILRLDNKGIRFYPLDIAFRDVVATTDGGKALINF
jgi:hypothetical protein